MTSIVVKKLLIKKQSYDFWCKEFASYEEGKSSGLKDPKNDPKLASSTSSMLKRKALDEDNVIPLCWTKKRELMVLWLLKHHRYVKIRHDLGKSGPTYATQLKSFHSDLHP